MAKSSMRIVEKPTHDCIDWNHFWKSGTQVTQIHSVQSAKYLLSCSPSVGLIVNQHQFPSSMDKLIPHIEELVSLVKHIVWWFSHPGETLTPRYTRKAQADRAPGFADKAL